MTKASFVTCVSAVLIFSLSLSTHALADDSAKAPTTGSTKPMMGNGPAVQKSLPSSAPPATTTATTGATNQSKTVKQMNDSEKAKVDVGGK